MNADVIINPRTFVGRFRPRTGVLSLRFTVRIVDVLEDGRRVMSAAVGDARSDGREEHAFKVMLHDGPECEEVGQVCARACRATPRALLARALGRGRRRRGAHCRHARA